MSYAHAETKSPGGADRILATDLDGTFIPLADKVENRRDLDILRNQLNAHNVTLVFNTGRHFASVQRAIEEFDLPSPDWIICDVGTSIYKRHAASDFQLVDAYIQHLAGIISACPVETLRSKLESISELRLQEEEKQGRFKLSYYTDAAIIEQIAAQVEQLVEEQEAPYSIVHSVDPFNGDGLIDLLPAKVNKAFALAWWVDHLGLNHDDVVFSGDSGNDLAALTAGYKAIVVGNAARALAGRIHAIHQRSVDSHHLYLAKGPATSGVLEGCRWFRLIDSQAVSKHRFGATPVTHNSTQFCVWAPWKNRVAVELTINGEKIRKALKKKDEAGYFTKVIDNCPPNTRYQYVLDNSFARPDPASASQPEGVHGPSQVIDHAAFPWTDQSWQGLAKRDLIIYEMHVGTFTQAGTFSAAIERLPELVDLGVTAVELMPVAQFSGKWNWGYDGVDLFAVQNSYGKPDDLKSLVNACHEQGLAVILDVVYNHVGPEGNYLAEFGPYLSRKHHSPWGECFNFDEADSQHVRRFLVDNALSWLDDYHMDGLRLDATHFIQDDSRPHILDDLRKAVSDYQQTTDRTLHLIAETNVYDANLLKENSYRSAYDALWSDCQMHAYYSIGVPEFCATDREYQRATDLAQSLQCGYVYAGRSFQQSLRKRQAEMKPLEPGQLRLHSLVVATQNHDAVGNHPRGKRLHQLASKSFQKAAAALTLLHPAIPLLFMGEEFASDSCFPFFVDFEHQNLRRAVHKGRLGMFSDELRKEFISPTAAEAFHAAKLPASTQGDQDMLTWYRGLIALRQQGIGEGWLTQDHFTTDYDAETEIFSLCYRFEDGGHVLVQARLLPPSEENTAAIQLPLEGALLWSSEPSAEGEDDQIALKPNHAVITRA